MSQENVDNLRGFLEAWDPRAAVEAWKRGETVDLSLVDPEIAYEDTILPDHVGETYHGYEGVFRSIDRWLEPFETLTIELERIVGTGDRLVSIHLVHSKARHTGIEFDTRVAYLWTFRDGKVIQMKSYLDSADALEAAGLRE
jgi:ketosteroid isomerase-like protein